MADAAHAILTRTSDQCTGRFLLDDDVLAEEGCRDFEKYAVTRGADQRSLCNVTPTKQFRLLIFRGSNVNTLKCRASGTARSGDRSNRYPLREPAQRARVRAWQITGSSAGSRSAAFSKNSERRNKKHLDVSLPASVLIV